MLLTATNSEIDNRKQPIVEIERRLAAFTFLDNTKLRQLAWIRFVGNRSRIMCCRSICRHEITGMVDVICEAPSSSAKEMPCEAIAQSGGFIEVYVSTPMSVCKEKWNHIQIATHVTVLKNPFLLKLTSILHLSIQCI